MDDSSINQEFSIVGDMITYYKWLFDVSMRKLPSGIDLVHINKKINSPAYTYYWIRNELRMGSR